MPPEQPSSISPKPSLFTRVAQNLGSKLGKQFEDRKDKRDEAKKAEKQAQEQAALLNLPSSLATNEGVFVPKNSFQAVAALKEVQDLPRQLYNSLGPVAQVLASYDHWVEYEAPFLKNIFSALKSEKINFGEAWKFLYTNVKNQEKRAIKAVNKEIANQRKELGNVEDSKPKKKAQIEAKIQKLEAALAGIEKECTEALERVAKTLSVNADFTQNVNIFNTQVEAMGGKKKDLLKLEKAPDATGKELVWKQNLRRLQLLANFVALPVIGLAGFTSTAAISAAGNPLFIIGEVVGVTGGKLASAEQTKQTIEAIRNLKLEGSIPNLDLANGDSEISKNNYELLVKLARRLFDLSSKTTDKEEKIYISKLISTINDKLRGVDKIDNNKNKVQNETLASLQNEIDEETKSVKKEDKENKKNRLLWQKAVSLLPKRLEVFANPQTDEAKSERNRILFHFFGIITLRVGLPTAAALVNDNIDFQDAFNDFGRALRNLRGLNTYQGTTAAVETARKIGQLNPIKVPEIDILPTKNTDPSSPIFDFFNKNAAVTEFNSENFVTQTQNTVPSAPVSPAPELVAKVAERTPEAVQETAQAAVQTVPAAENLAQKATTRAVQEVQSTTPSQNPFGKLSEKAKEISTKLAEAITPVPDVEILKQYNSLPEGSVFGELVMRSYEPQNEAFTSKRVVGSWLKTLGLNEKDIRVHKLRDEILIILNDTLNEKGRIVPEKVSLQKIGEIANALDEGGADKAAKSWRIMALGNTDIWLKHLQANAEEASGWRQKGFANAEDYLRKLNGLVAEAREAAGNVAAKYYPALNEYNLYRNKVTQTAALIVPTVLGSATAGAIGDRIDKMMPGREENKGVRNLAIVSAISIITTILSKNPLNLIAGVSAIAGAVGTEAGEGSVKTISEVPKTFDTFNQRLRTLIQNNTEIQRNTKVQANTEIQNPKPLESQELYNEIQDKINRFEYLYRTNVETNPSIVTEREEALRQYFTVTHRLNEDLLNSSLDKLKNLPPDSSRNENIVRIAKELTAAAIAQRQVKEIPSLGPAGGTSQEEAVNQLQNPKRYLMYAHEENKRINEKTAALPPEKQAEASEKRGILSEQHADLIIKINSKAVLTPQEVLELIDYFAQANQIITEIEAAQKPQEEKQTAQGELFAKIQGVEKEVDKLLRSKGFVDSEGNFLRGEVEAKLGKDWADAISNLKDSMENIQGENDVNIVNEEFLTYTTKILEELQKKTAGLETKEAKAFQSQEIPTKAWPILLDYRVVGNKVEIKNLQYNKKLPELHELPSGLPYTFRIENKGQVDEFELTAIIKDDGQVEFALDFLQESPETRQLIEGKEGIILSLKLMVEDFQKELLLPEAVRDYLKFIWAEAQRNPTPENIDIVEKYIEQTLTVFEQHKIQVAEQNAKKEELKVGVEKALDFEVVDLNRNTIKLKIALEKIAKEGISSPVLNQISIDKEEGEKREPYTPNELLTHIEYLLNLDTQHLESFEPLQRWAKAFQVQYPLAVKEVEKLAAKEAEVSKFLDELAAKENLKEQHKKQIHNIAFDYLFSDVKKTEVGSAESLVSLDESDEKRANAISKLIDQGKKDEMDAVAEGMKMEYNSLCRQLKIIPSAGLNQFYRYIASYENKGMRPLEDKDLQQSVVDTVIGAGYWKSGKFHSSFDIPALSKTPKDKLSPKEYARVGKFARDRLENKKQNNSKPEQKPATSRLEALTRAKNSEAATAEIPNPSSTAQLDQETSDVWADNIDNGVNTDPQTFSQETLTYETAGVAQRNPELDDAWADTPSNTETLPPTTNQQEETVTQQETKNPELTEGLKIGENVFEDFDSSRQEGMQIFVQTANQQAEVIQQQVKNSEPVSETNLQPEEMATKDPLEALHERHSRKTEAPIVAAAVETKTEAQNPTEEEKSPEEQILEDLEQMNDRMGILYDILSDLNIRNSNDSVWDCNNHIDHILDILSIWNTYAFSDKTKKDINIFEGSLYDLKLTDTSGLNFGEIDGYVRRKIEFLEESWGMSKILSEKIEKETLLQQQGQKENLQGKDYNAVPFAALEELFTETGQQENSQTPEDDIPNFDSSRPLGDYTLE